MSSVSPAVVSLTKTSPPRLPFGRMKDAVLGKKYSLSVVFVGNATSRHLNKTYRGKDKPANVLSFPLSKTEGEIFMNVRQARLDAPTFNMRERPFLQYLFIHGLLHLKGFDHGSKMEVRERTLRKKFRF